MKVRSVLFSLIVGALAPVAVQAKTFLFDGGFDGQLDYNGVLSDAFFELSGRFQADDTNMDGIIESFEVIRFSASAYGDIDTLFSEPRLFGWASTNSLSGLVSLKYSGEGFLNHLSFFGTRPCQDFGPSEEPWGSAHYSSNSLEGGFLDINQPIFFRGGGSDICDTFDAMTRVSANFTVRVSAVPLPASLPLSLIALGGLSMAVRRSRL